MSKDFKTNPDKLLDLDLKSVVESGHAETKKKKRIIAIFIAAAVIASILGCFCYRKYEEVKFTNDFLNSNEYTTLKQAVLSLEYMDAYLKKSDNSPINISIEYDAKNRMVVESYGIPRISISNLDSITPDLFPHWAHICDNERTFTKECQNQFQNAGYDVNFTAIIYDESYNEILYKAVNGVEESSYLDMSKTKDDMYQRIYDQVTMYVNDGNYSTALDYWDEVNRTNYYNIFYEDLSTYMLYAEALEMYNSNSEVPLADVMSAFDSVPKEFMDTSQYIAQLTNVQHSWDGTYVLDNYILKINGGQISIDYEDGSISGVGRLALSVNISENESHIKSGKLTKITGAGFQSLLVDKTGTIDFSIIQTEDGLSIKGEGLSYCSFSGIYTKSGQ